MPARKKSGRLRLIDRTWLHAVVGTDRDVDDFLEVAVVVPEQNVHRAVELIPAFVDRRDTKTFGGSHIELDRGDLCADDEVGNEGGDDRSKRRWF